MDQKLMQGMLLAAVFCLIFAVTMTWVDIAAYGPYRTAAVPRAGAGPRQVSPPSAAAPGPGEMEVPADTAPAPAEAVEPESG